MFILVGLCAYKSQAKDRALRPTLISYVTKNQKPIVITRSRVGDATLVKDAPIYPATITDLAGKSVIKSDVGGVDAAAIQWANYVQKAPLSADHPHIAVAGPFSCRVDRVVTVCVSTEQVILYPNTMRLFELRAPA